MDETTDASGKMCPILTTESYFSTCLKEQCAWWNADFELCAFAAMALTMTRPILNEERER